MLQVAMEWEHKAQEFDGKLQELSIEQLRSLSREQAQQLFSSLGSELGQLSRQHSMLVPKLPVYELNRYQKMLDSFDAKVETLRKGVVSTSKFSFGSWTVEEILEKTLQKILTLLLTPNACQSCEQWRAPFLFGILNAFKHGFFREDVFPTRHPNSRLREEETSSDSGRRSL